MYLTHKNSQVFPFPDPNPNPKLLPSNPKPFDETLIRRLNALRKTLPPSSPSVPLSFLAAAVDLLSATLLAFARLLSDPNLSRSESDVANSLSSHLDASAALLDAANSLSSIIDRISRRRLHLLFALHLLARRPLTPELTRKARDSVAEWAKALPPGAGGFFSARDLIRGEAPHGKASAIHRASYAVEVVSALVVGLVSSFLLGEKAPDLEKIRASAELPWSAAFNGLLTAVSGKFGSLAAEIEAVDESVKELTAAIDDVEKLRSVTEVAEKRTADLTAGLDRLGSAVDELFRAGLSARDAALQGFRVGPRKCK